MPSKLDRTFGIAGEVRDLQTDGPFYAALLLLFLGLFLGGIQSTAPLLHLIVESMAVIYLVIFAIFSWKCVVPRWQIILAILILAVPLIQLVPLPYAVWSALPNRDLVAETDRAIGFGKLWRPMTMSVEGTLRAFVSLLPPLAVFLTVPSFSLERRRVLVWVVLSVAAVSLTMSAVQFGASPGAYRFYRGGHDQVPVGIFANRNHQANFMLVCMPLMTALLRSRMRGSEVTQILVVLAAILALSVGALATNSRTGFALIPVAIAGSLWVFAHGNPAVTAFPKSWIWKGVLTASAAVLVVFIVVSTAGMRTLIRFDNLGDLRFDNWPLVIDLIGSYFPWGSGLGTFDPVFRSVEDLNQVNEKYFNHAHNDFLELLLESGVLGAAVGLTVLGVIAVRLTQVSARTDPLAFAAGVAIILMLAHSLIDYPLRTYTLSITFALCATLLFNPVKRHIGSDRRSSRRTPKVAKV